MIFIKKDLIWNNRTNTIYSDTKDYNRFQQKAKLKQLKKKTKRNSPISFK